VDTRRGSGGGVGLARPAGEISLNDVVSVMEGGVALNRCQRDPGACTLAPTCPVHPVWQDAGRLLADYLERCSILELATRVAATSG
jgi:DNA-binding IscR family transcriptional regulator